MRIEDLPLPDSIARLASNLAAVFTNADARTSARFGSALLRHAPEIVRCRNLRPADAAMAGSEVRFNVGGTEVRLDGSEFSGAREMYCRQVYFSHPRVELAAGSTVVDLGANAGLFTLIAALRGCRVVAVEGQRGFADLIERRMKRVPHTGRVDVVCALIGATSGVFADSEVLHSASHFEAGQPTVHLSMDELMARHQLERIDFLKCDIEGSEFALLEADTAWLSKVNQVAMEVHPNFGDPSRLVRVLNDVGMHAEVFDDLLRRTREPAVHGSYLFAYRDLR